MGDDFRFPALSPRPKCRGIPLGDGNFTVCAYGDGTAEPFRSPNDCPICNAYAPEIGRIQTTYGSRVCIDLVYSEPRLTAAQARTHATSFSLGRSELLLDPNGEFALYCKASVTPQALVYDSNGRKVYSGRIDDRYISLGQQRPTATQHDLRDALEAILSHKQPKPALGAPVGCFIVTSQTS